MINRSEIEIRLKFYRSHAAELRKAIHMLTDGGASSYTINNRQVTNLDLDKLFKMLQAAEDKIDELEGLLAGIKPRRAFAILPRDW